MPLAVQFTGGNRRARRITRAQFDDQVAGLVPGFSLIRRVNAQLVFIRGDGVIPAHVSPEPESEPEPEE